MHTESHPVGVEALVDDPLLLSPPVSESAARVEVVLPARPKFRVADNTVLCQSVSSSFATTCPRRLSSFPMEDQHKLPSPERQTDITQLQLRSR